MGTFSILILSIFLKLLPVNEPIHFYSKGKKSINLLKNRKSKYAGLNVL